MTGFKNDIKTLKRKISANKTLTKFLKFIAIGSVATLIDYAVMILLKEVFLVGVLTASATGFITALIFNYKYNMKHVFVDLKEGMTKLKSSIVFLTTSLVGLGLNQLVMYILAERLHIYYILSKLFSIVSVGLWNFFSKKWLIEK